MNATSGPLVLLVLVAVDRGTTRIEIVRTCGVSFWTIARYVERRRKTVEDAPVTDRAVL